MIYFKPEFRELAAAVTAVQGTDHDKAEWLPECREPLGTTTSAAAYEADE